MPPRATTSRSRTCSSNGPLAPVVLCRPDLLVVEQGDHRHGVRRRRCRQRRRGRPARHLVVEPAAGEQRHDRRQGPLLGLHVEEAQLPPESARRCRWRRRAIRRTRQVSTCRCPTPDGGAAACRASGRVSFTPRSRWIASCGTRATGRCTSTRCDEPSAVSDPSGDAEVAVEPRVEQHTAVDLDAELLPTRTCRCRDAV